MIPPMRINHHVTSVRMSATAEVMAEAHRLKAEGVEIVDLGPGEPDFPTPQHIQEAAVAAMRAGKVRYTRTEGIVELRQALAHRIANRGRVTVGAEQIVITSGAKHALALMCLALLEPGDEAMVLSPYWVSFPEMVRLAGARPVVVPCEPAHGFHPDPERILESWTPRTRLLILNFPNNPSGAALSQEELDRIVTTVADLGGVVLSDETYEDLVFDGRPHATIAPWLEHAPENVALVGSTSKSYAMTGWRLGWAVGHRDLMGAVVRFMSHTTSNACTLSQYAALAAVTGPQEPLERMRAEYQSRRDLVVAGLDDISAINCTRPEGAFYAFPTFQSDRFSGSRELARALLRIQRVAVVPGAAFAMEGALRISFACSRDTLSEGIERIGELMTGA